MEFEIKYCGICHTDVHVANNEFGRTEYPCVPGHELAGVVTKVGSKVRKFKPGDRVGVGCISDSCMKCWTCKKGEEHGCREGFSMTYGYPTKHGNVSTDKGYTMGGYSRRITVHQRFVLTIPNGYPLEAAGPIFCAGITMV